MHIDNIRIGFATSSSSTHSIIRLDPGVVPPKDHDVGDGDFGWNHFTAASRDAKLLYLTAILRSSMSALSMPDWIIQGTLKGLFGLMINDGNPLKPYIDHQSLIGLPKKAERYGKPELSIEFFEDLQKFLLQEDIIILGGNDNGDGFHNDEHLGTTVKIPVEMGSSDLLSRKDGDWWTLFSTRSGAKIRFSFEKDPKPYECVEYPELIDVSITDHCEKNCPFCYRDCTDIGGHAPLRTVKHIIHSCSGRVFELAIGGGEPTSHPDLLEILELCKESGITPNLSTADFSWFEKDPTYAKRVVDLCGAIGVTITTKYGIRSFSRLRTLFRPLYNTKWVIHVPMGVILYKDLKEILRYGRSQFTDVVLLDLKTIGRATDPTTIHNKWYLDKEEFSPLDYPIWLSDLLLELMEVDQLGAVGMDTPLAAKLETELVEKLKTPRSAFLTQEGVNSMYIDATNLKYGKSSYSEKLKSASNKKDYQGKPELAFDFVGGLWRKLKNEDTNEN